METGVSQRAQGTRKRCEAESTGTSAACVVSVCVDTKERTLCMAAEEEIATKRKTMHAAVCIALVLISAAAAPLPVIFDTDSMFVCIFY